MVVDNKAALAALALMGLGSLAAGCTTSDVDIGYSPVRPALPIEGQAATFEIGQFTDRRDQTAHWVGEIRGKYHYPKSTLETGQPVSQIVREIIRQSAEDRGMLKPSSSSTRYQLYGHITRLDGIETEATIVRAHLVSRLINLTTNREVHTAEHKAEHVAPLDTGSASDLESLIEEALNEVVADSLDDPNLREALLTASEEN